MICTLQFLMYENPKSNISFQQPVTVPVSSITHTLNPMETAGRPKDTAVISFSVKTNLMFSEEYFVLRLHLCPYCIHSSCS